MYHPLTYTHQRCRKDDSLEFGNQVNGPNKNNEDTVGRPQTPILSRSGYFRQLRDQDIRSPTRQMLQVPKIQSHRQLLPRKVRHLRPMRRPSPNKGLCRKTTSKRDGRTQMPQLQGRPLYGQFQMSIPQGNDSEKDASTSSPSSSTSTTGQIRMGNKAYNTKTVNIHSTRYTVQVSTVTTLEDFPDTLMTSGRPAGLVQEVISTKLPCPRRYV